MVQIGCTPYTDNFLQYGSCQCVIPWDFSYNTDVLPSPPYAFSGGLRLAPAFDACKRQGYHDKVGIQDMYT